MSHRLAIVLAISLSVALAPAAARAAGLPAPAGVVAAVAADGGIAIGWQPVPGAVAYRVWRDGLALARVTGTSARDWPAGRLAREYSYTVQAVDATSVGGANSPPVMATPIPRSYPWAGAVVLKGPGPRVALTIDDCYNPRNMQQMVAILREEKVAASFFCTGEAVSLWPAFFADLAREFPIGNHTWDHPRLTRLDRDRVMQQLTRTTDAIETVTRRVMPPMMRPPGGYSGGVTREYIAETGLMIVKWDRGLGKATTAQPGSIVLLHPRAKDVSMLRQIIQTLRAKGYEFITIPEMLGLPWQPAAEFER